MGVQLSSIAQSCPTLCNPMDCSTPGLDFIFLGSKMYVDFDCSYVIKDN